ncbi:MAG: tRNA pseudouridine(38-40) synthase TruA [Planctomycetota bacterium]
MSRCFRLVMEYSGAAYHGFKFQGELPTIEGELRRAAERLAGEPVETLGASRTDTGVHALGQCVRLQMRTNLEPAKLARALAAHMPVDIGIVRCEEIAATFDPRRDAQSKRYLYYIQNRARRPVIATQFAWWVRAPLDAARMHTAAQCLVGEHDFAALQNHSKDMPLTTVRTVFAIDWRRRADAVVLQVIGSGFLYRMVRNIVGTCVEIGRGAWDGERLREALNARDRRLAGPSAPAHGLYLMEICYPGMHALEIDENPVAPS